MHKNKVGDKVIFIGSADILWNLEYGETYTISNLAFDSKGDIFYSLKHKDGNTSWCREEDFISLSEQRKLKLEKINENS